jgi:hypothetical protein
LFLYKMKDNEDIPVWIFLSFLTVHGRLTLRITKFLQCIE